MGGGPRYDRGVGAEAKFMLHPGPAPRESARILWGVPVDTPSEPGSIELVSLLLVARRQPRAVGGSARESLHGAAYSGLEPK